MSFLTCVFFFPQENLLGTFIIIFNLLLELVCSELGHKPIPFKSPVKDQGRGFNQSEFISGIGLIYMCL